MLWVSGPFQLDWSLSSESLLLMACMATGHFSSVLSQHDSVRSFLKEDSLSLPHGTGNFGT